MKRLQLNEDSRLETHTKSIENINKCIDIHHVVSLKIFEMFQMYKVERNLLDGNMEKEEKNLSIGPNRNRG